MPRGLLAAHLADGHGSPGHSEPGADLASLAPRSWASRPPTAFRIASTKKIEAIPEEQHSCRDFDGHNCFCKGGEHCIQPATEADKASIDAHSDNPYILGCTGHVDGEDGQLLLDGHKKGLKGARCVPEISPNMEVVVKDGHETITTRVGDKDIDIIPRYPMTEYSKKTIDNILKLNSHEFAIPARRLHRRDEWIKAYKEEMHDIFDEAMKKLHGIIENVNKYENKGEDEEDPDKEQHASLAGALIGDEYAMLKADCMQAAMTAQKICSKADHCPALKCFRGEEEEEAFLRYEDLVYDSFQEPGKHGIRKGLKEAGLDDAVIDDQGGDGMGVAMDMASRGAEPGGKVSAEEHHFARKHGEEGEAEPEEPEAQAMPLPALVLASLPGLQRVGPRRFGARDRPSAPLGRRGRGAGFL